MQDKVFFKTKLVEKGIGAFNRSPMPFYVMVISFTELDQSIVVPYT